MIKQDEPDSSANRKKRLSALRMKLRSPKPSDVLLGMKESTHWLREDPEDWEVYGVLLDSVKETSELRDQVRNLLLEMMQNGSSAAKKALSIIPSSVHDLLADADDAYYAGEYEQALQVYRQVLKLDPQNARAKDQIAKAKFEQSRSGDIKTGLPRDAVQFYRRARSYIAAKDFSNAIKSLSAAIESAQARDMDYPDADNLLSVAQDSLIAEEFKQKAKLAMESKQWKEALGLYDKALRLEKTDETVKKELDSLQTLLRAESDLRKRGIFKIFAPLRVLQNASEAARGVMSSDNPLLNFIDKQLNQIRLLRIGSLITLILIGIGAFLFFSDKIEIIEVHPATNTPIYTSIVSSTLVYSSTPAMPETPTQTASSIPIIAIATDTAIITATNTLETTPTISILGHGTLTANVFPVEEPNGKAMDQILYRKQPVTILEEKKDHGFVWYKCRWEVNGVASEGWILAKYVQRLSSPSSTP